MRRLARQREDSLVIILDKQYGCRVEQSAVVLRPAPVTFPRAVAGAALSGHAEMHRELAHLRRGLDKPPLLDLNRLRFGSNSKAALTEGEKNA